MNVVCVDIGSTYTKAALVDVLAGELLGTAQAPTTADVVDGVLTATADDGLLGRAGRSEGAAIVACSSAGGGLRLAVVGYEELISAEAGHRAALSAGARVVHVAAGRLGDAALASLRAVAPDVVLLVGGTDGGEASVLRHNAAALAGMAWPVPVVLAGNSAVRDEVSEMLTDAGLPVRAAGNVLPDIGRLAPESARTAIREVFLRHVIGGSRLSRGPRLAALVRAATPEAVLTAVELLADSAIPAGADLLVVDVGGATTDVYSALVPEQDAGGGYDEVAGVMWCSRTVEGDLGVRGNAPGVIEAARAERLLDVGRGAGTVHLVEVDVIGAEAAQ